MEIVLVIVAIVILCNVLGRDRFWNPFRGAPNVSTAGQANAVTNRRISQLLAIGQIGNALIVVWGKIRVQLEVLSKPTIIFGLPGAGKTTLINLMMPGLFDVNLVQIGGPRHHQVDVGHLFPPRHQTLVRDRIPIK